MINKRGQGLSTNAIILIVLGLVVLGVLILGFTLGWRTLAPWISGNNVDTIVNQCESACVTSSKYSYCTQKRELKAEEILKDVTCYYLSEKQLQYGIKKCPSINCDVVLSDGRSNNLAEEDCWDSNKNIIEGLVVYYLENNQLKTIICSSNEE